MNSLRWATGCVSLVAGLLLVPAGSSAASGGDLDPAFGMGGKVIANFGDRIDEARGMAIQPDGKIVAAGEDIRGPVPDRDFGAMRFNTDGSLDPTFGTGGMVSTDVGKNFELAIRMELQSDGKIVAAGWSCDSTNEVFDPETCDIALVRYNTNGSLDRTFDGDGIVLTDLGGKDDEAWDLSIQRDGKIVAAGFTARPADPPDVVHSVVLRYNADGSLDPTFGTGGKTISDFAGTDSAAAVAVQADGRIVIAGSATDDPDDEGDFMVARYTANGVLDPTFDGDGRRTTDFPGTGLDEANTVTVQADGKILAAGGESIVEDPKGGPGKGDFALVRYNANGSLDGYFGSGGLVSTNFAHEDEAFDIAFQPDGRFVVVGVSDFVLPRTGDFAVARYNTNGSLDPGFSYDGKVTTDFAGSFDNAFGVGIQRDGKIVVAGRAGLVVGPGVPTDRAFGVARYLKS